MYNNEQLHFCVQNPDGTPLLRRYSIKDLTPEPSRTTELPDPLEEAQPDGQVVDPAAPEAAAPETPIAVKAATPETPVATLDPVTVRDYCA